MSGFYRYTLPGHNIVFEADRIRREHNELIGELTVRCDLPNAVNGVLSVGTLNVSSVRARQDRAKHLQLRANLNGKIDWLSALENLCQGVMAAERDGHPAIDLRSVSRPSKQEDVKVEGLRFPLKHPSILFGDGGAAKSYTALFIGGRLAKRGFKVALFDWELSSEDHRERLELLFGADMPLIVYCRCDQPLLAESDRLRRFVREHQIDYAIYDSIAFACDGPPEAAEVASRYFRSVREIGCGSLHIAHISKAENADQKPFGSAFWHNGARSTWFVQAADSTGESSILRLGFFNRKANLGSLQSPVSLNVHFLPDRTEFKGAEITDTPDLAEKLTVRQQISYLLRRGARTVSDIANEIGAKPDTVRKTISRYKDVFIEIDGGRFGLKGIQ